MPQTPTLDHSSQDVFSPSIIDQWKNKRSCIKYFKILNKFGCCMLDDIFSQVAQGGKKKKKTPQIKQVRENDFDEGEYDEFDDFM